MSCRRYVAQVLFVNRLSGFGPSRLLVLEPRENAKSENDREKERRGVERSIAERVSRAPALLSPRDSPASHKFSTHFPLRKKNAPKKAFPALRSLELDNIAESSSGKFRICPRAHTGAELYAAWYRAGEHAGAPLRAVLYPRYALRKLFRAGIIDMSPCYYIIRSYMLPFFLSLFLPFSSVFFIDLNEARYLSPRDEMETHLCTLRFRGDSPSLEIVRKDHRRCKVSLVAEVSGFQRIRFFALRLSRWTFPRRSRRITGIIMYFRLNCVGRIISENTLMILYRIESSAKAY